MITRIIIFYNRNVLPPPGTGRHNDKSRKIFNGIIATIKDIISKTFTTETKIKLYCIQPLSQGRDIVTQFHRNVIPKAESLAGVYELFSLMLRAANGIAVAHQNNIRHGDVKPNNIMLANSGQVKLVDFGFAHHVETEKCTSRRGTPGYLAPEVRAHPANPELKSDIYSLAVIFFELLYRKHLKDHDNLDFNDLKKRYCNELDQILKKNQILSSLYNQGITQKFRELIADMFNPVQDRCDISKVVNVLQSIVDHLRAQLIAQQPKNSKIFSIYQAPLPILFAPISSLTSEPTDHEVTPLQKFHGMYCPTQG